MTEDPAPYNTMTIPHYDSPGCDCDACRLQRSQVDIAETHRRMKLQARDDELDRVKERALDLRYAHVRSRDGLGNEVVDWCLGPDCDKIVATARHRYRDDAERIAAIALRDHMEDEGEWPEEEPERERPPRRDSFAGMGTPNLAGLI